MSVTHRRCLGPSENGVVHTVRHKNFIIVYSLALETTKPLTKNHVEGGLLQLMDTYPLLKMKISEERGAKYFEEASCSGLDFMQMSGLWYDCHHVLLETPFDENGPLWRARFLTGGNSDCSASPNRYYILLSFHHAITDGTSILVMTDTLMKILSAKVVDDELSRHGPVSVTPPQEDLLTRRDYKWSEVSRLWKKIKSWENIPCSWAACFPVMVENNRKTKLLRGGNLDAHSTESLIKRCKEERATVNGAVMAAINIAMYNHFVAKGHISCGSELPLRAEVDVNLRRFLDKKYASACGLYMNILVASFVVKSDSLANFWQAARYATECTHKEMSDEFVMRILTLDTVNDMERTMREQQEKPSCHLDYAISNLGDISSKFPGVYENLEVLWFNQSTSCQDQGYPFCFFAETFRRKLHLNADIVSHHVSETDARTIIDQAIQTLRQSTSS